MSIPVTATDRQVQTLSDTDMATAGKLPKVLETPWMRDYLTRGAMLSSHTPIAALGFDPRHTIIDTSGEGYTVAGLYSDSKDKLWTDPKYLTAIVHESIHRGLNQIREEYKLKTGKKLPDEEMIVRRIMDTTFQGVEGLHGEGSKRQMEQSRNMSWELDHVIKVLNDIATQRSFDKKKYHVTE